MNRELRGVYRGPIKELQGSTATIHTAPGADHCVAQFDDRKLVYRGEHMAFGWKRFPLEDFDILEGADKGKGDD
jgi:hypothetical protein